MPVHKVSHEGLGGVDLSEEGLEGQRRHGGQEVQGVAVVVGVHGVGCDGGPRHRG